jgi:hypothetical protein
MTHNTAYQPNFALLVGLVWLVIVGQLLWLNWTQTGQALGDTDDAMRLVEVRAFLAGRGWFDLHEPRLQPPIGYDSHWSRLIDAGLAGLFLIFRLVADSALAERLMRVVWPLLWLVPAMVGTLALAWRLAGRPAALVALLLLLFGLPAFQQFKPGRIDHHDVQITLALLTLAAAAWADRVRWAAWVAGALSGLALAIGVESLPFIALAGGAFAVRYAFNCDFAPVLAAYGWSVAASAALAFLISVHPDHYWTHTACDAIAINSAAPAILGGLTLGIAGRWGANESLLARCAAVAIALSLAAVVFVLIDPRCLAGPLALVDPAVRPIWFNHVTEIEPLIALARRIPAVGIGITAYPIAVVFSAIMLARQAQTRRDFGFIVTTVALIVAIAMTIVAIRGSPYTMWLGIPLVAAALLRLFARLKLVSLPLQMLVVIPFTPALLSFGVITIMESISPQANNDREGRACLEIANYAPLARLPAGLIVTDIDYGPFVLALTPHSVLAAPYHRASYGIVTNYRALIAPPDEAREILRRAHATYVMICTLRPLKELPDAERQRSLWGQLQAGITPNWLERMPNDAPFAVYRLTPQ